MATKVRFSLGYTLNTGNYESVRFDLAIEDEKQEGESTQAAYERIKGFVQRNIEKEVEEVRQELDMRK